MLFNLVISIYDVIKCNILLIICSILLYHQSASTTELRMREDSKVFVRVNIKINSVEYSKIFAYALGFRVNFDLRKSKKPKELHFRNDISTYFHPHQIRNVTEYLFEAYGWNGTACLVRTMCEISQLTDYSYDLIGPLLKLVFLGSIRSHGITKRFCEGARYCPVSLLHLMTHDEF